MLYLYCVNQTLAVRLKTTTEKNKEMTTRTKIETTESLFRITIKIFILLIVSTTILLSCNQTRNDKNEKSYENKHAKNVLNDTVALSAKPNVLKLSELPNLVEVTITNNTNDTITTGLHYRIEYYEKNEWNEVSPEQLFHDLGWTLIPSGFHTFETKLLPDKINYRIGKYRIVKYYLKSDYQNTKKDFNVYAEFNIE